MTLVKRKRMILALVLALTMLLPLAACTDETRGGSIGGYPADGPGAQPEAPGDGSGAQPEGSPKPGSPDQGAADIPSPTPPLPSPPPDEFDSGGGADKPEAPPPQLSYEEARAICGAWIDDHPDLTSYELRPLGYGAEIPPPTYDLFGEQYYEFGVSFLWDQTYSTGYSHVVLVHADTGEMLSLFMSQMDGGFLTQTVLRLDDWYSGEYAAITPALLSPDEAAEFYDAWIEEHRGDRDVSNLYSLDKYFYAMYEIFGDQYYHFSAEEDYLYWYNILVHADTGELLFMMTSDGMFAETIIATLDEWASE